MLIIYISVAMRAQDLMHLSWWGDVFLPADGGRGTTVSGRRWCKLKEFDMLGNIIIHSLSERVTVDKTISNNVLSVWYLEQEATANKAA